MLKKNKLLPSQTLGYLLIIVLVLGIFFRVVNLEQKVYWVDEAFTSLRISGYTPTELSKEIHKDSLITAQELQKYQYPNEEKNLIEAINSIAVQGTVHVPLYFVLARFWLQLFGNSVAITRSFSVFLSIVALPCIYLLSRELFKSPLVGWIAIALMSISPFQVLYAQEARPYSLWTVTILLSSWALLRALRLKTILSWCVYALTLALGFYTFLYSLFVAIGHGIYVLISDRFQFSNTFQSYLVASFAGVLAFVPWIIVIILNWNQILQSTTWQTDTLDNGIPELILKWGLHITRIFVDFDLNYNFSFTNPFPYLLIILAITIFVIYSLYFLYHKTEKETYLFIFTLIGATALCIILPDLIVGGRRSGITRYLLPCYLGIQLSVAYLLTTQLNSNPKLLTKIDNKEQKTVNRKQELTQKVSEKHFNKKSIQTKKIWQLVIMIFFSLGILSCINSLSAETWWNKSGGYIPQVARIINQTPKPLVINEGDWWLFSLSHHLKPEVQIQIFDSRVKIPQIPDGFSDYFLYHASENLLIGLQDKYNYKITPIENYENILLSRLEK